MPHRPFALTDTARIAPAASAGSVPRLEDDVVVLFDEYRDRLLRYLLTLGLPVPDGEEVIQEVFLSLFRHLQHGKSREHLRGWLFRVAHNLALKRRERMRRSPESAGDNEFHADAAVDPGLNPEDDLLHRERHRRLAAAYAALPEADRRCLALRAEGLRYREIAGVLDMSLGAVSLSLTRSLARIARAGER